MITNWKKFAVSSIVLASALTLAACNNASSTTGGSTTDKLVVSVEAGYIDYVEAIKTDFEKETGIEVEVKEGIMVDTLDKLPTDGPTGAAADVLISPYDRVGGLGSEGQIAAVELGNEEEYDETTKSLVTSEGKVYGAPAVVETLVLYYNKDLISSVPTTFTELEELQKDNKYAFAGEEGKSIAFLANWTDFYYGYGLVAGYGGYVFGDNGKDASDIGLDNNGSIEGLKYAKQWYDTWPQGMRDTTKARDFIIEQFTTGKTALIIEGPWSATSFNDSGINYGVAQIPTLVNGGKYEAFGGGKAWVVSNYTDKKEEAQQFLDYVTNEENQKAFYDATQEIPANSSAREYAATQGNDLSSAVIAQFSDAQPMPNIPQMAEVWEPSANMFFNVAAGKKDAAAASKETVSTIKEAIQQKYTE